MTPEPRKRRSPCAKHEEHAGELQERLDAIVALCDAGARDGWHAQRGRAIRAIAKGEDKP